MGFFQSLIGKTDAEIADAEFAGGYDPNDTRQRGIQQGQQVWEGQNQLAGSLQGTIAGTTPSVAEAQLQAGQRAQQNQLASQTASARGMNRLQAQRDAMTAGVESGARLNEQQAALRAQEVASAQGQLGGLYGTQQQAGLAQQGIASGEATAQMQAQQAVNQARFEQEKANQLAGGNFFKGLVGAGAQAAMMSDIRAKEDVERIGTGNELADALMAIRSMRERGSEPDPFERASRMDGVEPYRYRYRDDAAERMGTDTGMRTGVMAQDLERNPYTEDVVVDTPDGKALDRDRAIGASLAASAGLDKRIRRLESLGAMADSQGRVTGMR